MCNYTVCGFISRIASLLLADYYKSIQVIWRMAATTTLSVTLLVTRRMYCQRAWIPFASIKGFIPAVDRLVCCVDLSL